LDSLVHWSYKFLFFCYFYFHFSFVSMTSSVILYIMVDMGQTKYYELSICCFCANHVALNIRAKTGLLRIRLMCPSGATCLLAGSYFTEQALLKSKSACWSSTKWLSSSSSHWKTTCSHHYIAEKLLTWCRTTITHSLAHFAHTVEPFVSE
jgi:hypothetical protein